MHQKRHQPLHQVQPLQQPQQPLPRHTSVNRHGVVVALEDDDLDLLQVRMICNVQWVKLKQIFHQFLFLKDYQILMPRLFSKSALISSLDLINSQKLLVKKGQNLIFKFHFEDQELVESFRFFSTLFFLQFTSLMKKSILILNTF